MTIVDDMKATIDRLGQIAKDWQKEAAAQADLARMVGPNQSREIPDLNLSQLIRDLNRAAAEGIPAPLPRGMTPVMRAGESKTTATIEPGTAVH
jgi:hypothetical protein